MLSIQSLLNSQLLFHTNGDKKKKLARIVLTASLGIRRYEARTKGDVKKENNTTVGKPYDYLKPKIDVCKANRNDCNLSRKCASMVGRVRRARSCI